MRRCWPFWLVLVAAAGLSGLSAQHTAKPLDLKPPGETPVPFRAGEMLEYRVGWQNFLTAATARLRVVEHRPFYGRESWHFQAQGRTVDAVRLLYPLDDQFDSYTDTAGLASLQYEMNLREGGKREDAKIRMSTEGQSATGNGPTVRVPPGTRDPLGFLCSLRTVDWAKTKEVQHPVYDGKKLYEVRARVVVERAEVQVPLGSFLATKIRLQVYDRGRELEQTRLWVWLAQDDRRTPVLIEAELPLGVLRVELTRAYY